MIIDDYLFVWMIIYDYLWLLMIICDYLQPFIGVTRSFFVENIFIIISSIDKWASWLKTVKRKIQDFMIWKFYGIKNCKTKIWGVKTLFSLLKFYKMSFLKYSKWGGQLKATKQEIQDYVMLEL